MGWGIWSKIKNGIKSAAGAVGNAAKWAMNGVGKAVNGVGKAVNWVGKKVGPMARELAPIANMAAPILNSFAPGLGTGIAVGTNFASGFAPKRTPRLKYEPQDEDYESVGEEPD
jgi:phage-related protein